MGNMFNKVDVDLSIIGIESPYGIGAHHRTLTFRNTTDVSTALFIKKQLDVTTRNQWEGFLIRHPVTLIEVCWGKGRLMI